MPKKLALFILGLMLALGAFLLYQYVSGARTGVPVKVKLPGVAVIDVLPAAFEERDSEGNLVYLIRAKKAPEPILDDKKQPIPGQYKMENPEATFYKAAGRVVRLTADYCRIVLDQAPRAGTSGLGGGRLKDQVNLRSGELSGHVRLYISGLTATPATAPATTTAATKAATMAANKDPFPNGARIYFDGPVRYDRAQDQLNSADGVHIRSEAASYDGTGLKLAINQQAQRIDYLRIEKGKEILLRGMGDRVLISAGSPATASAPAVAVAVKPNAKAATIYRLMFSQDIRASAGDRSLIADRLNVIFSAGDEGGGGASSQTAPASAPAGGAGGAIAGEPAAIPDMSEEPEPIAAATGNDLHIFWSGPMELRPMDPAEAKLANAKDIILEALGTAEQPVVLKDAERTAQAGRLWYHANENRVELEPGLFSHVILADAVKGTVDCPAISIYLQKNAFFKGPGTLVMKASNGDPKAATTVAWTKMDVDLAWLTDAADSKKQSIAVRRAVIAGAVIKSAAFDLAADTLDALIATVTVDKKTTQVLEHMMAKGNVAVTSYRRDGTGEQGGLRAADYLEIFSTASAAGGGLVPSQMVAVGNVSAWRYVERTAPTTGPATRAAPGAPRIYEKNAITTARFVADLKPKAKTATRPGDTAVAALGDDFDVTHFLAQDDVKVEITPADPLKPVIRAVANKLDAYPVEGKATLTAADGKTIPVRVTLGDNSIETRIIELDQSLGTFTAPGAGIFNLVVPADGKGRKTPMPMQITWEKAMSFNDKKHVAVFTGSPIARVPGEQSDLGWLRSDDSLTVQMKEAPRATTGPATVPATGPARVPASAPANAFAQGLTLDWIEAVGNVHASGAQLGPNNKMTRDFQFSALDAPGKPGRLKFTDDTQTFEIFGPGALAVKIDDPAKVGDKPGEQGSPNGDSAFRWKEGLTYDGVAGIVSFRGDVEYVFKPRDGFNFSKAGRGGALLGPSRGAPARGPATARAPDIAYLSTDRLEARFTKSPTTKPATEKTIASPIGLGTGNQDLTSIRAFGRTFLEVGGYNIGGDTLTFDVPKQTVVITPADGDRVIVEHPSTGDRVTGERVHLDMTKDKQFFQIQGMQGTLSGLGG